MHKKIGILGGLSPESTVEYYLHITRAYTRRFGDYGYPEIIIYSVTFQPYVDWPAEDRWDLIAQGLSAAAKKLEAAGADFIVISANTMHMVIDPIRASVKIPVLSLLDVVAAAVNGRGFKTVGLLGTASTMEKGFYQEAMARQGIEVLVPEWDERKYVSDVIYKELVAGQIKDESRAGYQKIIRKLAERGAQGVILGCTEIPQLINEADAGLPLFDTTTLHAEAALNYALDNTGRL
jgi:aspartate racemase